MDENVPATDNSVQTSLVFRTVPGVAYRVEISEGSLQDWETAEELYGMGHEFVVPMRQFTQPPPLPPGEPPLALPPPPIHVSLRLQPANGTGGGTVASWKSLDHGGPVTAWLEEDLHPDWDRVPLYAMQFGDHYFFVWHPTQTATPPSAPPELGSDDAAMLAQLETSLPAMNQQVAEATELARNAPPPAPTAPGDKKFWRIHADWSVDTDGDGSPDWAEFEVAADPTHPSHDLGNAFNGDQDGDGIPDGIQTDTDRDGTPDTDDAAPGDGMFNFNRLRIPRYALFETAGAEPPEGNRQPLQINDQGVVLFANGTWKEGAWQALDLDEGGLTGCRAFGMNGAGEIAGTGTLDLSPAPAASVVVRWSGPSSPPDVVSMGSGENVIYATPGYDMAHGLVSPDSLFSNDGRLLATSGETWIDDGVKKFRHLSRELWTLPGSGRQVGHAPVAGAMTSILDQHTYWGYDNITRQTVLQAPGSPPAPDAMPKRMAARPGGGVIAFYSGRLGRVLNGQDWKLSHTLGLATDLSADGVGIGVNLPGKVAPVMYNGAWHAFSQVAPQAPAPWNEGTVALTDTTAGGWILASAGPEHPDQHAAMLPLRVSGHFAEETGGQPVVTTEFVGTDDFSVGSISPGAALKDRLWINVPAGGSRTVKIMAPLSAVNPLTIEGSDLTFNGQNPSVTLGARENTVSIHAAAAAATGSEIPLDLKLGTAASASKPLAVKIMKPRTVKVSVHPVTLTQGDESFQPDIEMTEAGLKEALEKIFKRQVNISFQVKIEEPGPEPVDWDLNNDGFLQTHPTTDDDANVSPEQAAAFAAIPGSSIGANIRVFVLGVPPPVAGEEDSSYAGYLSVEELSGIAYPDSRRLWVGGSSRNGTRSPAEFQRTLAHEMGHMLLDWERPNDPGQGHPDQGGGVAPLKGTDFTRRLMVSGARKGPNPGHLLVKEEWDRIELWLQGNIDQQ